MAEVRMQSIYKQFGNTEVIHGVDLEVDDNEFVVLVGPSGCGKSTLLRLIAGLEDVTSGEIEIDGVRVDYLPPAKRGIAMVFQSYALYPHMNVYQNMSFGLRLAKTDKQIVDQKVRDAAEILQITELLERKPKELSGGQRQRVAIGRAIVRDPKVFLFDEPLSNLDAKLRVQMRIELTKLHRELNATMVYVTHDQVEAMTMADKIVVLREGYVEQVGAPLDLYHNPANMFVAGFIGSPAMNFMDGKISGISDQAVEFELNSKQKFQVPCQPGEQAAAGSSIKAGVRPEHLELTGDSDAILQGEVFAVERLGGETYLYVQTEQNNELTVHATGDKIVSVGDSVSIGFAPESCHLFDGQGQVFEKLAA
jgi:multiple sugar transport system ATP-binding protein